MRIRSIHPDACISETLASLTGEQERTFWRLLVYCDDGGRALATAKLIKAAIYPMHEMVTADSVEADLQALEKAGLLVLYTVKGKRYLWARSFQEYQHPKKPTPSKFPAPPESSPHHPPTGSPLVPHWFPFGEGEGGGEGDGSGSSAETEADSPGETGEPEALFPDAASTSPVIPLRPPPAIGEVFDLWNKTLAPLGYARAENQSPKRVQAIRNLWKNVKWWPSYQKAVDYLSKDSWWMERAATFSIDLLLQKNRAFELSEKAPRSDDHSRGRPGMRLSADDQAYLDQMEAHG